jgi:hypothetical protein
MDSVEMTQTNTLKTLFEEGDALGSILFFYNNQQQQYVGKIELAYDQPFLGQVPDFLANVTVKDICIVPNESDTGDGSTFFIHIGYFKQDNDPQQFEMEIKSCPESKFSEENMSGGIPPQS